MNRWPLVVALLVILAVPAGPPRSIAGEFPETPVRVEGTLIDKASGAPIAGAPVQLDRGSPVITDSQGRFVYVDVPSGRHELWVQDPEHVPLQILIQVSPGKTLRLRYALDPVGQEEQEEVLVTAERLKAEVSNTPVAVEEVKKIPGTQGDVGKIVQSLPGVARGTGFSTGTAGPGLLIQGAAPEDSKALIDGHVVPILYHFMGLTSVLNSDMLQSIDFMASGFGAQFGEAIGGIIDTRTRPALARKFGGYLNMNLIDAGFYLQGPLGDQAGFVVAARRSTIDAWLPSVMSSISDVEMTVAPVYYDYQAKLEWAPRDRHRLSLLAYGSSDEARLVMEQAMSGDSTLRGTFQDQIQFHRLQLGWDYLPAGAWEVKTSLMAGFDQYNFKVGDARYIRAQYTQLTARSDAQWQPNERFFLHFGGSFSGWYFHVEHSFPRPPSEGEVVANFEMLPLLVGAENTTGYAGALYAIAGFAPRKGSLLSGAVRLEYFGPPIQQLAAMPRFTASQELRPGTTLSASVGQYYQPPAQAELSKSFGSQELTMERAWHFALRLKQELAFSLGLDFEVFYKALDNLVVPDAEKVLTNRGVGEISGFQVMLRRELKSGFFGWLAYTFMRSQRKDGPDREWRLFDYDQTHILTAVAGYHLPTGPVQPAHGLGDGWDFGLRFQLVSGNPVTPMGGGIYDADYDTYLPIAGPINSERLPLYHRLDLRVDYTWAWTRFALSIYLDIQNVYNQRSIEGLQYNYDYTQRAYFRGLPVIPSLGVKGSF